MDIENRGIWPTFINVIVI